MHWVLDQKLRDEPGYGDLLDVLGRAALPHSFHKVTPFVGDLEPDIAPAGPVIVFGAYSMRHAAQAKGWTPGSFDLGGLTYSEHVERWGAHMLNAGGVTCRFADVPRHVGDEPFFIRPTVDSKFFAGTVMTREELEPWLTRVARLGSADGLGLRASTEVLVAKPKGLLREYRLWIVDGEVVTASLYRLGGSTALWRDVE